MAMSDDDLKDATIRLCKKLFVETGDTGTVSVTDLRAAVTAIDGVFDSSCGSFIGTDTVEVAFNKALPEPVKSTLTPAQKAVVLAYTAMKRFGVI